MSLVVATTGPKSKPMTGLSKKSKSPIIADLNVFKKNSFAQVIDQQEGQTKKPAGLQIAAGSGETGDSKMKYGALRLNSKGQ